MSRSCWEPYVKSSTNRNQKCHFIFFVTGARFSPRFFDAWIIDFLHSREQIGAHFRGVKPVLLFPDFSTEKFLASREGRSSWVRAGGQYLAKYVRLFARPGHSVSFIGVADGGLFIRYALWILHTEGLLQQYDRALVATLGTAHFGLDSVSPRVRANMEINGFGKAMQFLGVLVWNIKEMISKSADYIMSNPESVLVNELISPEAIAALKSFSELHAYTNINTKSTSGLSDGLVDAWSSLVFPRGDDSQLTFLSHLKHWHAVAQGNAFNGILHSVDGPDRGDVERSVSESPQGSPWRLEGILELHGVESVFARRGVHWQRFTTFTPTHRGNAYGLSGVMDINLPIDYDITNWQETAGYLRIPVGLADDDLLRPHSGKVIYAILWDDNDEGVTDSPSTKMPCTPRNKLLIVNRNYYAMFFILKFVTLEKTNI